MCICFVYLFTVNTYEIRTWELGGCNIFEGRWLCFRNNVLILMTEKLMVINK